MSGFGEAAKIKARVHTDGPLVDVLRGTPVRSCKTTTAEIIRYTDRKYKQVVRPKEARYVKSINKKTLEVRENSPTN